MQGKQSEVYHVSVIKFHSFEDAVNCEESLERAGTKVTRTLKFKASTLLWASAVVLRILSWFLSFRLLMASHTRMCDIKISSLKISPSCPTHTHTLHNIIRRRCWSFFSVRAPTKLRVCEFHETRKEKHETHFPIQNIRGENQYTFYVKRDREAQTIFCCFGVVEFACCGVFVNHEIRFVFITHPVAMHGRRGERFAK